MPKSNIPLAAREFTEFLKDYEFTLIADVDEPTVSYTVFGNSKLLLAFTYQQHDGENIAVAPVGAPVNTPALASRMDGWQLIGGVFPDFWSAFHEACQAAPYPHKLDRAQETLIVDASLRRFMQAITMGPNSSFKPKPLPGSA